MGTFSPVNRADRLADRSDECLLLLGQYVWSNNGNIAPSVDGKMVVSLILLWLDCSEGVYPCWLVSCSFC